MFDKLDLILVMSVNPGFDGQSFIAAQVEKIRKLKALIDSRPIELEVDGGINTEAAKTCIAAGARRDKYCVALFPRVFQPHQ